MTILPITVCGNPVLHTPARLVDNIDDNIRALIPDMFDTMRDAPGVGLAAPQIGIDLQIFVWEYSGRSRYDTWLRSKQGLAVPEAASTGAVINPSLELSSWRDEAVDRDREREGCLSVPGYDFPLRRADHAVLTGLDVHGDEVRVEAWGWLARIFQHEYDHLQGTLYVDRLPELYEGTVSRMKERQGWL